jgi:hypothetical protein
LKITNNQHSEPALNPAERGKNGMLKFMWNGLKITGATLKDDVLYRAFYSKGSYTKESKLPEGTITIYARDYKDFPKIDGLNIKNDSDSMTDYFETDRIYVEPSNKFYIQVLEAHSKQQAHNAATCKKRTA